MRMAPRPEADPVVAACATLEGAQAVAARLAAAGFPRACLSVVADRTVGAAGASGTEGRMRRWSGRVASLGALAGVVFGAVLATPWVDPRPGGAAWTILLAALEGGLLGAAIGASGAVLTRAGLPPLAPDEPLAERPAPGFVVLVHGTPALLMRARAIAGRALAATDAT